MDDIGLQEGTHVSLDFQSHLAELEAKGLLVRIDREINKDTELHPLVRCQFLGGIPEDERRAFLFTNVVDSAGRRYDIPVVVGAFAASPRIYAMGMGRAIADIGTDWLHAIRDPITPVTVTDAPCQEVVIMGDDLRRPGGGLAALPVPISTPGFDAAPYLTATLCVTADPDSGVRNIGTYRAALKSTDRLGVRMSSRIGGAGGYLHWCKYRERKERMPCAIVIGAAPVIMYTGPEKLAIDQDELSVAGALAGSAIRTTKAVTVDLEVPADAEIVIEGLIDTDLLEPEGPFGESNGYVALEDFNMSMEVTAITHRRKPVFASMISQVSPSESSVIKKLAMEPLFLNHLRDHLSLKSVRRVVMHEPLSNLRPIIFVQFSNDTPKSEIWRGLQGTAARLADCGKLVIAVSEDIEPDHTDAVMWSLAYRCNPIEDVHIEPYRSTGHSPKSGPAHTDSTMLIDATLKYPMAPLALPGREYMERAQVLWRELGLPALSPRSPWHGYSLGDWNDIWENFARNAVAGDWPKNGDNTWARRRGGLTPETPARTVETSDGDAK
ncbi:UbiD family decarboxylase [Caballeronia sp. dw_19]|uniref:UbiD family decarboxylase n=1 Tax=Caballeronia sp. dw_19 TaxID=2719791 RepID=UPI001BD6576C|nr:UbiD family decarboxylase [Caballeronia sp. dw_19]